MANINKFIAALFFLSIILNIISSYFSVKKMEFNPTYPYSKQLIIEYKKQFIFSKAGFDGVHYLEIAKNGYKKAEFIQAFFPVYPLLINLFSSLISNYLLSGVIISTLSFLLSLVVFYKLLKLDYKEKKVKEIIIYLTFFITSFYFFSVYTESIFLLLTLCFFYFLRQKKYLLAAIFGIISAATRITGIFLVLAFIYEIYIHNKNIKTKKKNMFSLLKKYFIAFIPALGLLSYMLYLKINFNDPLLFVHVQKTFGSGRQTSQLILLYQVFWRYIKMFFTVNFKNPIFFTICLELYTTVLFISLIIFGFIKKIRASYLIYSIPSIILPTLTGTFSSMPRYVLVLFPAFISLSLIQNKLIKYLIAIINFILLPICTALFTSGYWIS